ncbi:MAG: hypothetical protein FJ006_09575 [Chloroflexi bacterium]|nr:hypothetical protein [Chloroflexota bacterium]
MTTGWKYGKPVKEKLMALEEPGKVLLFDLDKGLVEDVISKFDVGAVAKSLQGKDEKEAYKALEKLGKDVMKLTIELADTKYMDRAGEMIEKVAKQTGISFPHRLERYVELSILGLRPTDRWNITKATTKKLALQVSACSVHKALEAAGVKGLPCKGFCFASFDTAAEKTGDKIKTEMPKTIPQNGMCEFHISV